MAPHKVLDFWFGRKKTLSNKTFWFAKSDATDRTIRKRFAGALKDARAGKLDWWKETPQGRLALIILLDQFSRNIYRGKPESFAADPQALRLAQEALAKKEDRKLRPLERVFLYMPFMHSEKRADQKKSVALFAQLKLKENLHFAKAHKKVIDIFGRFPHRNAILKRHSTKSELEYLAQPGAGF